MAPRRPDPSGIPPVLAASRRGGGDRADRPAGPRRHGLRTGLGTARHLRALRHHRPAGRVRRRRAQPDPRPWSRLVPGPPDRGRHPAPGRRQRGAGRRPGGHAGDPLGRAVRAGRAGPLRLHRRPAVQSGALRLHERDRADRAAEPAAQALRLLRRRPGRDSRGTSLCRRRRRRPDQPGGAGHRRRLPGRDPGVQAVAAEGPGRARRRGRGDGRGGRVRPGTAVRPLGGGTAPQGAAVVPAAQRPRPGPRSPRGRSHRDRPGLVRRHQPALADLRDPGRLPGKPEPGAGRPRRGQRRRRPLPGVLGQQQLLTDAGRRSRRRQDAGDRGGRRPGDRADAAVLPEPGAQPARCGAGGRGDLGGHRADRGQGGRKLYRVHRTEFALSIVCFLGVAVLGVIEGIFIAIALALLDFIRRAWRPYDAVLGRVDDLKGYHDVARHPDARRIPGLVLFRWDAPLFFANAEVFADRLRQAIASSPTPVRWAVVAAEPVTDVDTTAADALRELDQELAAEGIDLRFAEMKGPVKDKLRRYALYERFGDDHFYPTVGEAVNAYVETTGVDWTDWEDRATPTHPGPG